jgi:aminopeptidase-like protein
MKSSNIGEEMYSWASDLFPINRSITGQGLRETLKYIKSILPELKINEVKSGTKVFDWEIPNEWNVSEAYIEDQQGIRILDFKNLNLHLVGYSTPIDAWMEFHELDKHLYSIESQPEAIPYVTSYYKERWGFCISHNQRLQLKIGKYHVVIKSTLKPGVMNYGELIIRGKTNDEILLSTYICHPSMANNEISGPVVTMALAQWINNYVDRRYTYRIIFIPETIGAIAYLSKHWEYMKKNTKAGFVITCVGDDLNYSLMPSRLANTIADKISKHVCSKFSPKFIEYSFLDRGSDERQFCNPLIDLPVVSIMRSKYATYPEYHTSDDNMSFISPEGLFGGFEINRKCIEAIELNVNYQSSILGEPKMDKRGLRNTLGAPKVLPEVTKNIMNFLMYSDGSSLIDIADRIGLNIFEANEIAKILLKENLIFKI